MKVDVGWLDQQFPNLSRIEPLDTGGQKWVFRCVDSVRGPCVLKMMKPGAIDYLDREFEAVRRLSSDHVPQIYKIGSLDSQVGQLIWFIEQYVDGNVLSSLLAFGPLDKDLILSLGLDLLSAARDAESVKVVHRDIKPDNVIVDPTGKAWLLDFGIARILDLASKTRTDAVVGPHTPGYSAPEQFRYQKHQITGRSDLFAIGVVLFECATGVNPFLSGARDRLEVLNRVEQMPLPRLDLDWDVDKQFADIVQVLTQKFVFQRPSSCEEAFTWMSEIAYNLGR